MMPVTTSRVPATLDRLRTLLEADAELDGVALYDGSPLRDPDEPDVICIAPSTPDQPGVEVDYFEQPGLAPSYIEQAQIIVVVSSWSGDDDDMQARRQRVQTIVGRLQTLLAEHQVEPACWDGIGLGQAAEWYLVPSKTGVTAALGFTVVARALV